MPHLCIHSCVTRNATTLLARSPLGEKLFGKIVFSGFFLVSPTDLHPSLARMNEMIQSGILSEKHCHLQEISMFTSIFVEISEDPLRGITNLHKRFPAAVFLQEKIRNSVSGRQAYNAYLGKHTVGKGNGGIAGGKTLPRPDFVNHFGISPSNWYKKAPVPLVYDGVVVNYVETL